MSKEKKVWSELQDQLLRKLYEDDQMRNWSLVAKTMHEQFNTPKKSGKQCRERYENHIDSSVVKIEWTKNEEKQLVRLHDEIGNKWANIAERLPGRSDNCVKNHFYSKLRKLLRKLNKIIHDHFKRQFRQININAIYKLIEATEQRFKDKPNCTEEVSLKCRNIQNRLLHIAFIQSQEENYHQEHQNLQLYKNLIKQIYAISKEYKRKSKKGRNLSIIAPNIKKIKEKKQRNIAVHTKFKVSSDGYMSDSEQGSHDDEDQDSKQNQASFDKPLKYNRSLQNQQIVKQTIPSQKILIEEGKEGIENLLRLSNILQSDYGLGNSGGNMLRFSDKSSFRSYNSDRESDRDYFNMRKLSQAIFKMEKEEKILSSCIFPKKSMITTCAFLKSNELSGLPQMPAFKSWIIKKRLNHKLKSKTQMRSAAKPLMISPVYGIIA